MTITFTVNAALRLVEVRMTGDVTLEDISTYLKAAAADPAFTPEFRFLGDISGMNALFTTRDLIVYQQWRKGLPPFGGMAVVARTDAEFGVARMFELAVGAAATENFRVFRDIALARAWLELPEG